MSTEFETPKKINSLESYIIEVERIYYKWQIEESGSDPYKVWFRGVDRDESLIPSVFRKRLDKQLNELLVLNSFMSIYKNYTDERFENSKIELFSFMQHYGIPTRLLDWSESHLMALFFAIDTWENGNQPVVWILNAKALNQLTIEVPVNGPVFGESDLVNARLSLVGFLDKDNSINNLFQKKFPQYVEIIEKLEYPIACYPISSGNQRIIVQKGVFTVHGRQKTSIEKLMKEKEIAENLKKIEIDVNSISKIRESLRRAGITCRTVYPDLYGLSKELKTDFYYF